MVKNFALGWCRIADGLIAVCTLGLFYGGITNIIADKINFDDNYDSYESYYREW
jgi:hypothetical protein